MGAGVPGPGDAALIAAGTLAGEGKLNVGIVLATAMVAWMLGSVAGYAIGAHGGRSLLDHPGRLEKGRRNLLAKGDRAFGGHTFAASVTMPAFGGVEQLLQAIADTGREVDAVALNAGVGNGGAFVDVPLADEERLIDLNIGSTVHLAKRILPDMVRRGAGRMLFTSSAPGQLPGPHCATYAASKAFIQSFAQALRYELKDTGVTVTALLPGPTDTEFFERAGLAGTAVGSPGKDDPADVARDGFEALMAGQP